MNLNFKSPGLAGLFIFLAVFSGCDLGSSRIASRPVIQVNQHQLSAKEFSEHLARRLKNFDALAAKDPNNVKRSKEDILRVFILQSLIADFAEKNSLAVTEEELDKEINLFRSSYPDDLSFRRVLAEESLSLSEWKDEMSRSLLQRKVFKKIAEGTSSPNEAEISSYYSENKDRFRRKESILLRQIVVDDLNKAQTIHAEIKKGDFADLAKKYSVSPEAKAGGLVGWIERGSVDVFEKAFSLPVGGTSPVLESSYGFHIFRVDKKMPPGVVEVSSVRSEISATLLAQKEQAVFSNWLDKQIRASRVLKDKALLDAIQVETRSR